MALCPSDASSKAQSKSGHCLEPSTLGFCSLTQGPLFPASIALQVAMVTAFPDLSGTYCPVALPGPSLLDGHMG